VTSTLLILRPQPGAEETARRTALRGFRAIVTPLFTVRPEGWNAPSPDGFDAVLLTSANAARHGGASLAAYRDLPLYAVGKATGAAARAIGFRDVREGAQDAAALFAVAAGDGRRRLLHLAGRDHITLPQAGVEVTTRVVYAADAAAVLPDEAGVALTGGAIALLHSPRAARLFRTLAESAGLALALARIAAISPAAMAAARGGWAAAEIASAPSDAALLDAALRLCDQRARKGG
jgi:uroporphyrinogen-III synthase